MEGWPISMYKHQLMCHQNEAKFNKLRRDVHSELKVIGIFLGSWSPTGTHTIMNTFLDKLGKSQPHLTEALTLRHKIFFISMQIILGSQLSKAAKVFPKLWSIGIVWSVFVNEIGLLMSPKTISKLIKATSNKHLNSN